MQNDIVFQYQINYTDIDKTKLSKVFPYQYLKLKSICCNLKYIFSIFIIFDSAQFRRTIKHQLAQNILYRSERSIVLIINGITN